MVSSTQICRNNTLQNSHALKIDPAWHLHASWFPLIINYCTDSLCFLLHFYSSHGYGHYSYFNVFLVSCLFIFFVIGVFMLYWPSVYSPLLFLLLSQCILYLSHAGNVYIIHVVSVSFGSGETIIHHIIHCTLLVYGWDENENWSLLDLN